MENNLQLPYNDWVKHIITELAITKLKNDARQLHGLFKVDGGTHRQRIESRIAEENKQAIGRLNSQRRYVGVAIRNK